MSFTTTASKALKELVVSVWTRLIPSTDGLF